MNIILLSGGSGKRLWPLSNDVRSKQFLKIFKKDDGTRESMAMRMYRMIKQVDKNATITIATGEDQISQIKAQLGRGVGISVEPARRDTFPAITLAAAYLKKNGMSDNEIVVVCPVDPYVNADYFECLKELSDEAGKANLTLMGIEPTCPSEKYGYIIPTDKKHISAVLGFKEKPTKKMARKYIEQGALWNGGVFAFKLSYLLDIANKQFGTDDYETLYKNYNHLQKISFDYAVVEKEKSINVIRFSGQWKDLGTWNTLSEAMVDPVTGNATVEGCDNTHVINELTIPLIALGIKDAVIVATPDGILVVNKEKSPQLKDFVNLSRPMYERLSWGEYTILDYKLRADGHRHNTLVKELVINPGEKATYQSHMHLRKIWVITEGAGLTILNGEEKRRKCGDVIIISEGTNHTIEAFDEEIRIIEIQIGNNFTDDSIESLD